MENDFNFSAVDAPATPEGVQSVVPSAPPSPPAPGVGTDDFGFTLFTEEEIKRQETALRTTLEQANQKLAEVTTAKQDVHDKLHGLRDMIMPFLNNLMAGDQKDYIYWPGRADKMKAFIDKINTFVET